jgi:uncharacterized protein YndB with AHSA1/START domain
MMRESITLERDYDASPEQLFAAWTDVAVLRRWFGCGTDMLWTIHAWDARPGGALHVSLKFEHGPYEVRGTFVTVDAPRRLRYAWENDETIDIATEPHGAGSRLRLVHEFEADERKRGILSGGWTASLEQLRSAWADVRA